MTMRAGFVGVATATEPEIRGAFGVTDHGSGRPCTVRGSGRAAPALWYMAAVLLGSGLGVTEARASAFVWPASGRIATVYLSSHKAIDISNASGTPIYAARGGNLWLQNYQSGYGYYVKVDHDAGYRTVYAHLRGFYGGRRWVRQGDQVGYMGRSGAANGVNHLHWELQRWGVPQYVPATYLRWVTAKSGINWKFPGL